MKLKLQFKYDKSNLSLYIPIVFYDSIEIYRHNVYNEKIYMTRYKFDIFRIFGLYNFCIIKKNFDKTDLEINEGIYINSNIVILNLNKKDCDKWFCLQDLEIKNKIKNNNDKLSEKEYKYIFNNFVKQFKNYQKQYNKLKI